jgi:hypothetical protein
VNNLLKLKIKTREFLTKQMKCYSIFLCFLFNRCKAESKHVLKETKKKSKE